MPRYPKNVIRSETIEILDTSQTDWMQTYGARPQARMLSQASGARGYVPLDTPEGTLGIRYTATAAQDVASPPEFGPDVAPVTELQFEFVVRSMEMPGSASRAAVATATITAGENSTTYDTFLEAPNGNFLQYNEFVVQDNRLVEARSWWSAFVDCLGRQCATVCLGALATCGGAWAAYILCVIAACGLCGTKCAACATCDCTWWCKWAAGCCDQ